MIWTNHKFINMGQSESSVVFYTIFADSHMSIGKPKSIVTVHAEVIHVLCDFPTVFRKIWLSCAFIKRGIFRMSEF